MLLHESAREENTVCVRACVRVCVRACVCVCYSSLVLKTRELVVFLIIFLSAQINPTDLTIHKVLDGTDLQIYLKLHRAAHANSFQ